MKNAKDIHIQMSETHYGKLKKIAEERGVYTLAPLIRAALIEHFKLNDPAPEQEVAHANL